MDERPGGTPLPPPPEASGTAGPTGGLALETCVNHPQAFTGVHCTRCGKPICPECMRPAAVGYQCPACYATEQRSPAVVRRGVRTRGRLARTTAQAPVTMAIVAITTLMFVVEVPTGASSLLAFGGDQVKMYHLGAAFPPATGGVGHLTADGHVVVGSYVPQLWRLFTPIFLHWGLLHLAMNMYALVILGGAIEAIYGRSRFLALYVVTGIMGYVVSFAFGPVGAISAGASTAVFGLFGIWLAYNYRRRNVSSFHRANLSSIYVLLLINIVLNIGFSNAVDWRGHVGGFAAGLVLGYTADGIGRGSTRRWSQVGGFVVVLVVGAALVVWRIRALHVLVGLPA